MPGSGDASEEYLAPENTLERMIQIYTRRARNYFNWLDYETAFFWAEKALALSIENHNIDAPVEDKISPFTKGSYFVFCMLKICCYGNIFSKLVWNVHETSCRITQALS